MWPYHWTGGFMMASGIMVLGMKLAFVPVT